MKPTPMQIKKFLMYLHSRELFYWSHFGDSPPDPELVAIVEWLGEEAEAQEDKP